MITASQVVVADTKLAGVQSTPDLINAVLESPETQAVVAETLGPFIRKYGHSALGCLVGSLIVPLAQWEWGWTMPQTTVEALSTVLLLAGGYSWQTISIWLGKKNAPISPAQAAQHRRTTILQEPPA